MFKYLPNRYNELDHKIYKYGSMITETININIEQNDAKR